MSYIQHCNDFFFNFYDPEKLSYLASLILKSKQFSLLITKTNNMSHHIDISMEFDSAQKKFFIQTLTMIEPKPFKQESDA